MEDPLLADRLGAAAREVVCARFGVDRMLARVQALYERALDTHGNDIVLSLRE
jgi:hypothetical protein